MVIMRKGENAQAGHRRGSASGSPTIEATLPAGVALVPFYEQARPGRPDHAHHQEEPLPGRPTGRRGAAVGLPAEHRGAVLVVALGHPAVDAHGRSSPCGSSVSANLMSLGALDFGLLVDASVVMVENIMRRAGHGPAGPRPSASVDAAVEVGRPVVFGIAIIIAVYVPIFALRGHRGKDVHPDGVHGDGGRDRIAGAGAHVHPRRPRVFLLNAERQWRGPSASGARYERLRPGRSACEAGRSAAALVAIVLAVAGARVPESLGTEFMPRLDEGSGARQDASACHRRALERGRALLDPDGARPARLSRGRARWFPSSAVPTSPPRPWGPTSRTRTSS